MGLAKHLTSSYAGDNVDAILLLWCMISMEIRQFEDGVDRDRVALR